MTCPYCAHIFPLTWGRYWKSPFGKQVCPEYARPSRLQSGFLYWLLYLPALSLAPFLIIVLGTVIYAVVFPKQGVDDVMWFLFDTPGAILVWATIVVVLLAPFDRMVAERLRKLRPIKERRNAA
jgi:hypothetical protein